MQKRIKTKHPYRNIWAGFMSRCYNIKNVNYSRYGALGIEVCKEWREDFWKFVDDIGERPEGFTLDRIDSSKGYSKENCRWASIHKQALNTKSFDAARIYRFTETGKYQVRLKSKIGKYVAKTFKTPLEAYIYFLEHKQNKEEIL